MVFNNHPVACGGVVRETEVKKRIPKKRKMLFLSFSSSPVLESHPHVCSSKRCRLAPDRGFEVIDDIV